MTQLRSTFNTLIQRYSPSNSVYLKLWNEIEEYHSESHRHYHTLAHLRNLLESLQLVCKEIKDWNSVLFALFYHDVIYNPLSRKNELKSADLAKERMMRLGLSESLVEKTYCIILATKTHQASEDLDTNLFTDADLGILAAESHDYEIYTKQIRKEYRYYPNLIYNHGRKKVLQHFLEMPHIYKTDFFKQRWEEKARANLLKELKHF